MDDKIALVIMPEDASLIKEVHVFDNIENANQWFINESRKFTMMMPGAFKFIRAQYHRDVKPSSLLQAETDNVSEI